MIDKMKQIVDKANFLEDELRDNLLCSDRFNERVTAEVLIKYARKNPYILEMALEIAKEYEGIRNTIGAS